MKEKVECVVIGGSIAGCVTATLLSRLGMNVTILERSSGKLKGQGAGITLSVPLINKCIELGLFDESIPRLPVEGRSFFRTSLPTQEADKIWAQPLSAFSLNWMDVYRNLRKRLHGIDFRSSVNVLSAQKRADGRYTIETADGTSFDADIVIAADGVDSAIRKQFLPESLATYTGYIAWRGVLEADAFEVDRQLHYYVFPQGHILFYRIPADDYEHTGKTLLNWVMYEITPPDVLSLRLTDNKNIRHPHSIPPKALHEEQRHYLHAFSQQNLPPMVTKIIRETAHPFIQAVFDAQIQPYDDNQVVFMGDAAATLRPHSGSGVMKALSQAINLYEFLSKSPDMSLSLLLSQWKSIQHKSDAEEIQKAKIMGKALVTEPPPWQDMNQETVDAWWSEVMQTLSWYATQQPAKASSVSIFPTARPERPDSTGHFLQSKL